MEPGTDQRPESTTDAPPKHQPPRVIIIGGGFAGLTLAKKLGGGPFRVTLIDRTNHHNFQPLLYQVATAGLSPAEIAIPIRSVLAQWSNIEVLLGEVTGIDLQARRVTIDDGPALCYDLLVLATGMTHSYFGHPEWQEHAPGIKTLAEALTIRHRVLMAFERAEREHELAAELAESSGCEVPPPVPPTFVVVGAGPTGLEVAGALSELARFTLERDFRHVKPQDSRIILLGAGDRMLETFPPELSISARRALEDLGVQVRLNAKVTHIERDAVFLDQERIPSDCTIWAAGVRASPLGAMLGTPLDRGGRVMTEPDLSVPGHPEVFVVGDLAAFRLPDGTFVPGVAPAAMQAGRQTASNLLRRAAGNTTLPFRYTDKGSLATIGRAQAVAAFGKFRFSGYFAWLLWVLVHIFYLISFRNRFLVMTQWAMAWFTYQRGARLLTPR